MAARKRDRPSFWALFLRSTLMAVTITLAVQAARRLRRFEISGRSMTPALEPGDWVLVDELAYRNRLPHRGEVVVATDPREPGRDLVKRVSAVDLHGGVSLEGDNPDESTDSRQFGPVPASSVKGRVWWRYWPWGRVGTVR